VHGCLRKPPEPSAEHVAQLEIEVLTTLIKDRHWAAATEYAGERPTLVAVLKAARLPPPAMDVSKGPPRREEPSPCARVMEPEFDVRWVDSIKGVDLLEEAMRGASVVAIDAEWRDPRPCSTVQLALLPSKQTWVVCVLPNRGDPAYRRRVGAVLADCLRDARMTKVGFAFSRDLARIQMVCSTLLGVLPAEGTFLDLNTDIAGAIAAVAAERPNCAPAPTALVGMRERALAVSGRSLAILVHAVFGETLSKGPQVSDWDRRPLTATQLAYAALDAEVLARLYTALRGGGD
jgi:hypothetical protein